MSKLAPATYFRPLLFDELVISITKPFSLILILVFWSAAAAQEPPDASADRVEQADASSDNETNDSAEMKEMARAMKSMADMCQMMMQQEMKQRPFLIAAGATVGTLLVIALVLFIVLEIQWIRYFQVRIRTEKIKS